MFSYESYIEIVVNIWDMDSKKKKYFSCDHNETRVEIRTVYCKQFQKIIIINWAFKLNFKFIFLPPYSGGKKYLKKPLITIQTTWIIPLSASDSQEYTAILRLERTFLLNPINAIYVSLPVLTYLHLLLRK